MSATKRPSAIALKRGLDTAVSNPTVKSDPPTGRDLTPGFDSPKRPRPEKPVRFTLDLDRAHHRFLKTYATDIEATGAAEVMRALLDELRDDPDLAARVRARVWQAHA